jgi:hypothetical protein
VRWLVTTGADADLEDLRTKLEGLGCEVSHEPPTPLGDEQVVRVVGPDDLPAKVTVEAAPIRGIYPDSEMELY